MLLGAEGMPGVRDFTPRTGGDLGWIVTERAEEVGAVNTVYELVLDVACPRCQAQPGAYCVNPKTEKLARMPCVDRLRPERT